MPNIRARQEKTIPIPLGILPAVKTELKNIKAIELTRKDAVKMKIRLSSQLCSVCGLSENDIWGGGAGAVCGIIA